MQLIDINCAIGAPMRSKRYTDHQGLLTWMDNFNISNALVYHSEAMREPEMGNSRMLQIAADSCGRIKSCLALTPTLDAFGIPGQGSALERLKAAKPSAVRVFPEEHKYPFDPFYAGDVLQVCQQLHLPVIVNATYDNSFLSQLPQVCRDFPDVPVILPRFGMNRCHQLYPILKKLPNVYADMSLLADTAVMEEIVNKFGSEHLLFGSGLPTYEPSGALGLLLYARISDTDRQNIASGNFLRLEGDIRYDD